jgi:hypothetical protein
MVCETKTLGVGRYTTRNGREACVDAVSDGMLIGRYMVTTDMGQPCWVPKIWTLDGHAYPGSHDIHDIGGESKIRIERTYWLNEYDSGPGLLRKTWEESLIEASREEKQPLCRVELKFVAFVGDGLR